MKKNIKNKHSDNFSSRLIPKGTLHAFVKITLCLFFSVLAFLSLSYAQVSTSTDKYENIKVYIEKNNYIQIINSCNYAFSGVCVNARSGPSTKSKKIMKLRNGTVLRLAETKEIDGQVWYRVEFKEWLRYPERIKGDVYVTAEYAYLIKDLEKEEIQQNVEAVTDKKIIVDIKKQKLIAYDGDKIFLENSISTGIAEAPTDVGTFYIFRKTPSRYMQGPIPGVNKKEYDLPGVPWTMYFTGDGAAIHGAYWHNDFGRKHSSGCINLPTDVAEKLYMWADIGMSVKIK
jgi:lipoprotein-anchoring transpeptidase ErfK/SrfK